jgi:hypothetical protein
MRRAETCAAGLVLVASACGALLLGFATWTNLLAAAVCFAAVGLGLWRAGWIGSSHRIVGLSWLAEGGWLLADGRGNTFPMELSADTCVARNAVWLHWIAPRGRCRSMLLVPSDLPANQLRALCVRLRIEALERASPEARRR